MNTDDNNQEVVIPTEEGEGEGDQAEVISISKSDYDKLNQTLGSMKRELKDLKKPKEEAKETPQKTNPDNSLLEKAFLRTAGISTPDEVEFALSTAPRWLFGLHLRRNMFARSTNQERCL